jgi:acyl-homoserine-lactone acylase
MKKLVVLALLAANVASAQQSEITRLQARANTVTIIRDDWGIAHIHGKTDADAVFGLLYAQAEDDFNRVETNYLNAMGRLAEAEGESKVYQDLRMKLFIDPDSLKAQYARSPRWLQALMNGFADGLNYYLATHPNVKPRVITHFEPWMALSFTEGSIGGDIESIGIRQLEAFYGGRPEDKLSTEEPRKNEDLGSNGFAIAPSRTVTHHALLLINPHTSFFFRSEAQVTSDDGLNAYGAVTWGQIFVYQGFNERVGWMHTSSGVDNIDEYAETIIKKGDRLFYKYGAEERPVVVKQIAVPYRTDAGLQNKVITVYATHHGPVVRDTAGKWVSVRLMQEPLKALTQSYTRTKAHNYQTFRQTMELHTNSSNNTIFADVDGDIAYFHANFIPRRDTRFNWSKPVDGSDQATDWHELLSIEESPLLLNPHVGWLYNSNDPPWWAAGANSPRKEDYPSYVETGVQSARGRHAVMVLEKKKDFTIGSLREAAYDSYLPYFADAIPELLNAYDAAPDPALREQIELLRTWDFHWDINSVPTSLAVYYGEALSKAPEQKLAALAAASEKIAQDFGSWKTPWGEINRFQRLTGDIVQPFNDAGPSVPVGFTSANSGSLASFKTATYGNTKRRYGVNGNSFVAVVEFGERVRAIAVTAGGESGDPKSPHFNDQAQRYATGDLRPVYFYPDQLEGHIERKYHPGN